MNNVYTKVRTQALHYFSSLELHSVALRVENYNAEVPEFHVDKMEIFVPI